MTDRIKRAYEEGQFQALADLGVLDTEESADTLTKLFKQLPDGEDAVDSAVHQSQDGDSAESERTEFEKKHVDTDDTIEWSAPEIHRSGATGRY